ncbi:hypothetical protein CAPTEDRAFT_226598 [Capitella teleta]|uniref:Uncharacterized protein n=1 Tax=Capitella teleta TaxID=283909 RepID=R7T9F8_CAPTE|nr:hypothetical protein CAPTEDRAFT_226598 [Capitella teleta]|eukprot:ELT87629.1 hypothetical protein CAPTEDRAFT_226598 [Capitella teleta]
MRTGAVRLLFFVMVSHLPVSSASRDDNNTKQITNVVSSPVQIQTHVIWKPPTPRTRSTGDPKLLILPLGAFLALIIATCAKISHWWNEDIREADGLLENVYSAKYPHRPVLARVLSMEPPSYDRFTRPPFSFDHASRERRSPIVVQSPLRTDQESDGDAGGIPIAAPSAATAANNGLVATPVDETVPLLHYHVQRMEVISTDFTPVSQTIPSSSRAYSARRKPRKERRYRKKKRLTNSRTQGVSRLVMNSLNFNLFLLKLDVKDDKDAGFIEDSFIHPGQDFKQTIQRTSPRRKWPLACRYIASKPSSSSFSSYATSSTSLSTEFSDSRHFYRITPRSASLSSDSGASSDVIWEMPDQCPGESYDIDDKCAVDCNSNTQHFCVM